MSMSEWAKREVSIACKKENPDREEGEFDYGCGCYESALKAYLSLMEDGHSGMSFGFTKQILIRLMNGLPLTPIEDTPDIWNDITEVEETGDVTYQCKRMSSLFKTVKKDGSVSYTDIDRYYCYDLKSPNVHYLGGGASDILNEMFPITMPYMPSEKKYAISTREHLTDRKNGDFDTKAFINIHTPDGECVDVYRYFAEVDGEWKEIDLKEYNKRISMHWERVRKEKEEIETLVGIDELQKYLTPPPEPKGGFRATPLTEEEALQMEKRIKSEREHLVKIWNQIIEGEET